MGTRFELVLVAEEPERFRPVAEAALDEIEVWHQRLTRFEPGSLVSFINRTAATRPIPLDRETYDLFACCQEVWRASEGAFDITIGSAMERLGFHDRGDASELGTVGMAHVELDPDDVTIRFCRDGLSLDLGAVGKGHAVDCAVGVLRGGGVNTALLHGGTSSAAAIGRPPGSEGWRVALGGERPVRTATLHDNCLSVSRTSGRTVVIADRTVSHIIDPRDQAPVGTTRSVAVIGPSARLCDAWSTALLVLDGVPPGFPAEYEVVLI